jgi:hypothetical protein
MNDLDCVLDVMAEHARERAPRKSARAILADELWRIDDCAASDWLEESDLILEALERGGYHLNPT